MYSGTALISTTMTEPGIVFPPFEYRCNNPYVTRCELTTENGHEITAKISLENVPTAHDVEDIALAVHKQAMLRLECLYGMRSGQSDVKVLDLRSEQKPNDHIIAARTGVIKIEGHKASIIQGKSPDELRDILERPSPEADIYFELFNQARTSSNKVVEFLGYYQIVSSIHDDPGQHGIDQFFLVHDRHMPPLTHKPDSKPDRPKLETVYTRLRNEIAHVRHVPGTARPKDISATKAEISEHVERLRGLAVTAIRTLI
jgi:hypothetical protein